MNLITMYHEFCTALLHSSGLNVSCFEKMRHVLLNCKFRAIQAGETRWGPFLAHEVAIDTDQAISISINMIKNCSCQNSFAALLWL